MSARRYPSSNAINGPSTSSYNSTFQERDNNEHIDLLSNKVSALKSLAIDIGTEVHDQNRFLANMGNEFDRSKGILSGTMNKLQRMMKTQNGGIMCYMTMFVVIFFLFLYWMAHSGGGGK